MVVKKNIFTIGRIRLWYHSIPQRSPTAVTGNEKGICEPVPQCLNVRPRVSLHAPLIFFIGHAIQAIVITALSAPAIHNGSCTFPVAADI